MSSYSSTPMAPAAPVSNSEDLKAAYKAPTSSGLVRAYDPARKKMVMVPEAMQPLLEGSGYAVGDKVARQMAHEDGWAGAAESFALNAVSGVSSGLSDVAMPKSVSDFKKRVDALHPTAATAGQVTGIVGQVAATGGIGGVAGGIAARTALGAVAGATEEYLRAKENSEPINAERILQQAGIKGLINLGLEGAGLAVSKAGEGITKSLGLLDKVYPGKGAIAATAGSKPLRQTLVNKLAGDSGLGEGFIKAGIAHMIPGAKGVLAADYAAVKVLNNLETINSAIVKYVSPAAHELGAAVRVLTETGNQLSVPDHGDDPHAAYQEWRAHLEHAMTDPTVIEKSVSAMADFSEHEMLRAGVILKGNEQVNALYNALPRNPGSVLIAGEEWKPTTKQVKDFLDVAHVVTDFPKAMESPTRAKILMAKQTNPEQLNVLQDSLTGYVLQCGTKGMSDQQMRSISLILGMPINRKTDPKFIQKMQGLHQLDAMQQQAAPAPSGGAKPKSLTLDATDSQMLDFGLE